MHYFLVVWNNKNPQRAWHGPFDSFDEAQEFASELKNIDHATVVGPLPSTSIFNKN